MAKQHCEYVYMSANFFIMFLLTNFVFLLALLQH